MAAIRAEQTIKQLTRSNHYQNQHTDIANGNTVQQGLEQEMFNWLKFILILYNVHTQEKIGADMTFQIESNTHRTYR